MKTKQWYSRQIKDPYVKKATRLNFVSRSAFKLIEIDEKYSLINKSNSIIDLGSSPGGWIQVILNIKSNDNFKLISIDKVDLKINDKSKFYFIKNDFQSREVIIDIERYYNGKFDLILSDMAPNTIGHTRTDHLRIIELSKNILSFSLNFLSKNSNLILKIWQGGNEKELTNELKKFFNKINYFKPKSSRQNSAEIYLICLSYKQN